LNKFLEEKVSEAERGHGASLYRHAMAAQAALPAGMAMPPPAQMQMQPAAAAAAVFNPAAMAGFFQMLQMFQSTQQQVAAGAAGGDAPPPMYALPQQVPAEGVPRVATPPPGGEPVRPDGVLQPQTIDPQQMKLMCQSLAMQPGGFTYPAAGGGMQGWPSPGMLDSTVDSQLRPPAA